MGRIIQDPKHLKNRVLMTTYLSRCLPTLYLNRVGSTPEDKQLLRNILTLLTRQELIVIKESLHGLTFLILSKKGYDYVTTRLLTGQGTPQYQHEAYRVLRKNVSEHSFMNFLFIWHEVTVNPLYHTLSSRIYEDSNINDCKLRVYNAGQELIISPDILALSKTQDGILSDALFVENDTGRETYKTLYHKLVEYAVLIEKGMMNHKLHSVTLYFITKSNTRLERLFQEEGLTRFFRSLNNTEQITDVRDKLIISAFSRSTFTLYVSSLPSSQRRYPYDFKKLSLHELLLRKNPTWRIYQ